MSLIPLVERGRDVLQHVLFLFLLRIGLVPLVAADVVAVLPVVIGFGAILGVGLILLLRGDRELLKLTCTLP